MRNGWETARIPTLSFNTLDILVLPFLFLLHARPLAVLPLPLLLVLLDFVLPELDDFLGQGSNTSVGICSQFTNCDTGFA